MPVIKMKEEVSIQLQGGLGNYLFQISCAYAYAKKHNKNLILSEKNSVVVHKHINNYKTNILNNVEFLPSTNYAGGLTYNEPNFCYQEIPYIQGDVFFNGYFQTEKYFKEYDKEIKELFSYPQDYVDNIIQKYKDVLEKNTCSIHIRRGDYLNSPNHHPAQNMNYYMKAVKQMPKDSVFLIFSDDMKWCKDNFPNIPEKFVFIEGNSDVEDLLLQSMCKNNIICNSTFSWWAAWLNKNENKKIIVPNTWFGNAYSHYNTKDLIPEGWLKI